MLQSLISDWSHLDPTVSKLWRIEAAVAGVVYGAIFVGVEFVLANALEAWPVQPGFASGALGLALVAWLQYVAGKKYEFWRYQVGDDDLAVAHGIWWQTRAYIPRARIQHVDVTAGPISRALGLAVVSVFVGGQAGAVATIPGLDAGTADHLRRTLLRLDTVSEPPPVIQQEGGPLG
ncbi:MAG: PH domain-containing protein [Armatimonadetes bacterium]|nr:PH domain-containing protein [Armatimonadota bacterium]